MSDYDWMLACDIPACVARYMAHEDLRGTGEVGVQEARRRAALDGWHSLGEADFCPVHAPVAVLVWGYR